MSVRITAAVSEDSIPELINTIIELMRGTVKWYNETKGFGFITAEGEKDVFVHRSGLKSAFNGLEEGAEVEFEIEDGKKGPIAVDVEAI